MRVVQSVEEVLGVEEQQEVVEKQVEVVGRARTQATTETTKKNEIEESR